MRGPALDVASEQAPGDQPWQSTMAINYGNQLWRLLIAFLELNAVECVPGMVSMHSTGIQL